MKHISIITLLLALALSAQGQVNELRRAGKDYDRGKYDQAEARYRRLLEEDSNEYRTHYNLGNTLYRQKKYEESVRQYQQTLENPSLSKKQRAHALHNQGNGHLQSAIGSEQPQQTLEQAINCYQEALKLDPKNDDTRYNLAYARRLLEKQQQQQQQGGGNNQKQKNDNNKQKNDNQQNNQSQQNQDNQPQNQQPQQEQRQDQKTKYAERMLEAVKNNERQALRDKQKNLTPAQPRKTDKDW